MKNVETYKREFSFLDADRKKVEAECEITLRNGYPEFTASGNYANGGGQIFDHVTPANDYQKQFIELWETWHLNGMNAGTQEQTKLLEDPEKWKQFREGNNIQTIVFNDLFEKRKIEVRAMLQKEWKNTEYSVEDYLNSQDGKNNIADDIFNKGISLMKEIEETDPNGYTAKCYFLKYFGMYEVKHPKTGEPYKYGHGWIVNELPEDFESTLDTLIDSIEETEEERKGESLSDLGDTELIKVIEEETSFTGRDAELCAAFVKMFDLSTNDLQDVEINDTYCAIQGTDYLAGTDEEMDEEWEKELDNYIDECVLPELPDTAQRYFDSEAWKRDAKYDGRGHSLNRYDGGEEEQEINGTWYYAYRQ